MRLRRLRLHQLRNIPAVALAFAGGRQFFTGENGQGKTNLIEAAGFVTALRSFRAADPRLLIQEGKGEAGIECEFEHERLGTTRLLITLRPGGREVWRDGVRLERLADHLGVFPTVVFSSHDQQLIRGAPGLRRRWLDLTLAAVDGEYLRALQAYHRALAARNQLLKRQAGGGELAAFERPLAEAAAGLAAGRARGVAELAARVAEAYGRIAASAEPAGLALAADAEAAGAEGWAEAFERWRGRDLQWRTTGAGPHRDELEFTVGGRRARDFGSEGQQRSLVMALRWAQAEFFRERTGVEPVLLIDDVLGELDAGRRGRFWAGLGEGRQVLATGTSWPDAELGAWERFRVAGGTFTPEP